MTRLTVDGYPVEVPEGSTVLDAARALGVDIPTLCHAPGLPPSTSCMLCVVRVEGYERMLPACTLIVGEGMVVESEHEAVKTQRQRTLELLLSEHRFECGTCSARGECKLRNQVRSLRPRGSLFLDRSRTVAHSIRFGHWSYEEDKCILCRLCVEVARHHSGSLTLAGRGISTRVEPGFGMDWAEALGDDPEAVIAVCPTGALS